ncbi:M48 family metallopeptidase [Salimicrobium salexigens]|uniref:YgjP-like metallopeptidase domain-containing protein n=1 Tax=Salimicrobium salexigens TaxID=908941 RepID=A0ABY1KYI9_9BACI|nr:SprT family zinc-dependent metalloprotease [Salimicrobium salexigens]SIS90560.1 hypothetical protein SAMN05421758_10947 [Salimicrobium salexigens]
MTMPTLQYGTTTIEYFIYSHERKDMKIAVDLVNGVIVYVPPSLEEEKIQGLIQQKAPWILSKIKALGEVNEPATPKDFVSGEKIPYLGRNYKLKVYREALDTVSFKFHQGKFLATVPRNWTQEQVQQTLEQTLIDWYKSHGFLKIKERVQRYQKYLGVTPRSVSLRNQRKRWGTCTPEGNVYFNWRILLAPVRVIDYIIVHELAHLAVPEHNEKFWNLIRSVLPDYEGRKEWLRVHGIELHCIG